MAHTCSSIHALPLLTDTFPARAPLRLPPPTFWIPSRCRQSLSTFICLKAITLSVGRDLAVRSCKQCIAYQRRKLHARKLQRRVSELV